jgi:hypothetical protein
MRSIYDLETSVNRMVDYILETGNKNNTIDISCTHDFQLALLLLFLNGISPEYKQKLFNGSGNWPFMLEGMFLWKSKSSINALWRDEKYTFRRV